MVFAALGAHFAAGATGLIAGARRMIVRRLLLASTLLLAGCEVGPDYHKPPAPMAMQFKELAGWKPAAPLDGIDRGAWWSVYKDPLLDKLERSVVMNNQTVRAQEAAYREA